MNPTEPEFWQQGPSGPPITVEDLRAGTVKVDQNAPDISEESKAYVESLRARKMNPIVKQYYRNLAVMIVWATTVVLIAIFVYRANHPR
jgi:hypothetical protein